MIDYNLHASPKVNVVIESSDNFESHFAANSQNAGDWVPGVKNWQFSRTAHCRAQNSGVAGLLFEANDLPTLFVLP